MGIIDADFVTRILTDLVKINSVNPALSEGATNEAAVAAFTAEAMASLGLEVTQIGADPTRPNVVGRLPGRGSAPSIMLYAHYDTVSVEGMDHPFSGEVRDGRVYGRGAYDMKGGLAACLGAIHSLRSAGQTPAADVLIVAVSDEEVASEGIQEVLRHVRTDAAVVTEPTELRLCLAHKGFCWIRVRTHGEAAHGSRFDLGVDANMRMGRFLASLSNLEQELVRRGPHPLLGPPSLHAGTLHGGTGPSTYAAACEVVLERRTIPGEDPEDAIAEVQAIVDSLAEEDPTFRATVEVELTRHPFEASPDSRIIPAARAALTAALGHRPEEIGQSHWMDAAFISAAGIDTVVLGPRGEGAHAVEEWVDLSSVVATSASLVGIIDRYQGP